MQHVGVGSRVDAGGGLTPGLYAMDLPVNIASS